MLDGRPVGLEIGRRGLKPGRPTLILIHGTGGSRLTWRCQTRPLDKNINIAALELPGHGETPGPPLDTIAGYADWTTRVLEALPLATRPVLGGISMGGAVAMETALAKPDLLAGLILIATGARLCIDPDLVQGLEKDFLGAISGFAESIFTPKINQTTVRQSFEVMAAAGPEVILADLRCSHDFNRQNQVRNIQVPALVLCGEQDRLTPPELSIFLADKIPGGRLEIIKRAGHMPHIEQWATVNRAILNFIQALG